MAIMTDTGNILFRLAAELVNQSSRNIFLTGKAGTGKTTFLKYIRENCSKQMAVVAPTGVAAINAGGVTIHSFFQLPFSPFVPETKKFSGHTQEVVGRHSLIGRLKIAGDKLKVIRQLELLIIDEISMVRCDTIDAIDTVLRHVRKRPYDRFGGVQVLFIGDMFQLPPVIKDQEWNILREYYSSPYFFDSEVIREQPPVYIEFQKIYRQSEEQFIGLLNKVRNNDLDSEGMEILEKRFQSSFERHKGDGFIVLTTHNDKAKEINRQELENLGGRLFTYKAEIKNEFPENAYPADEVLQLKAGAQVMFIKNDSDKSKRYFNGKIGTVIRLEPDKIVVQCKDDQDEIEVAPETWDNIRYTVNKTTRGVDEDVLGSFVQYPLRLAWAITIHKSQGLTFEKAIIDAGNAFAAGQVYVALSRCTSLDGLVLKSRVRPQSLAVDERIVRFSQSCHSQGELETELIESKRRYQETILLSTFDFTRSNNDVLELKSFLKEYQSSFNSESLEWIDGILLGLSRLQGTAVKFHSWIRQQFAQPLLPTENIALQTKVKDGAVHFSKGIQEIITLLQQSPCVTDSLPHAKEFNDSVKAVFAELSMILFILKNLDGNFDVEAWHKKKRDFVLPSFSINAYAGSSERKVQSAHPVLMQRLRKLRDTICSRKDLPIYMVAGSKTLDEMVNFLPQTPEELIQVNGFGKAKVDNYGQQFIDIIKEYCEEKGLSSRMPEIGVKARRKDKPGKAKQKSTPAKLKPDTREESLRLYREGMTIADIAQGRDLTIQTIEGHLAQYVQLGQIGIEELVKPDAIGLIEAAIKDTNGVSLTAIKEKVGNSISYGEIRLVLAWISFKNGSQPEANTQETVIVS